MPFTVFFDLNDSTVGIVFFFFLRAPEVACENSLTRLQVRLGRISRKVPDKVGNECRFEIVVFSVEDQFKDKNFAYALGVA